MSPSLSAIVVTRGRLELLRPCLSSLRAALAACEGGVEAIVVDNGSGGDLAPGVRRDFPGVRVLELEGNRGYPAAVNEGVRSSGGAWVLTLNDDTVVEPDAVAALLRAVEGRPDVGMAAAQIRFMGSELINSAGIGVDRLGVSFDRLVGMPATASEPHPVVVFGASGGAALYRREMLDQVGPLDETFFMFLEDVDLAWRAQLAGWRCLYVPAAVVQHHHSASATHGSGAKHFHVGRNRVRLLAKHVPTTHLVRYGALIVAYDAAYVTFAAIVDRSLAPLRGRLAGVRQWRADRRVGTGGRRPLPLARPGGLRAALRRHRAYRAVGYRGG